LSASERLPPGKIFSRFHRWGNGLFSSGISFPRLSVDWLARSFDRRQANPGRFAIIREAHGDAEPPEHQEERGTRFRDAAGVQDADAWDARPQQRERHGLTVVVVRVQRRPRRRRARVDDEAVFQLVRPDPEARHLSAKDVDAVRLVPANVGYAP